ncbi:hypothetical protein [Prevotella sp. HUN102]|uniref:hypothetical protein n=1 Tax=Prevotella sp. HUN102 TaxID=1392486 RepID=UPI0012DCB188|nr:hypothetical protein [Prevotella sp. HUN102]
MKKRSKYYIAMVVGILMLLTSCTNDIFESLGGEDGTDGVPVTLTFATALPGGAVKTRSPRDINNLTLLVFNDKHRYLYRAKAALKRVITKPAGIVFEPELARKEIVGDEVYEFTVTLMTSTKPRIIHFVADYDKLDEALGEDHTLKDADEGEIMPRIISQDQNSYTYWQSFFFSKIDNTIFNNKGFKLLRNKAKFTIKDEVPNDQFELKGFSIHNAPDRGTVVSYAPKTELNPNGPRPFYRDVLYTFPIDPTETTMPSDIKLDNLGDTKKNLDAISVFEYSNSQADPDKQMSIILYGRGKADKADSYYKLDITRDIYADPDTKQKFIGTQRFDVIRNYNYIIRIKSANGKGYPTYDEAVRNPASNNLFGSVELENYSDVTDGEYTLIVDNTKAIMTLPGHFYSPITFAGTNLEKPSEHVDVYLNGKECNGHIDGDPYIDHAEYNKTTGVLDVNVKDIPTAEDKHYVFNVVATAPNKTTHIQRTIELILRKRYDFKMRLEEKTTSRAQGSEVDVVLTIPGTLPATLYPFDVYIAADQLSPLVTSAINDQMKVLKYGKRTYYVYTVRTASTTDQEVTLHFQRTRSNGTCDVTAISDNFYNADAILPNDNSTQTDNRGLLTYTGISYTVPKVVPSEYRTKLSLTGTGSAGVTAKMASAGYVEFGGAGWANAAGSLTLTATMELGNGVVKATKMLSADEWRQQLKDRKTINLDITDVTVEEKAQYKESNAAIYKQVPGGTQFKVRTSDASGKVNVDIQSTGVGTYKMIVTGLKDLKTPIAFTCEATIYRKKYETNSIYLSKIFDAPVMYLTPHFN